MSRTRQAGSAVGRLSGSGKLPRRAAQRRAGPARLFFVEAKMAGLTGEHDGPAGLAASELPAARGAAGPADRARQAGTAKELTELFRAHHLELVRLALVMVGDLATAEDVVQDAFERLHSRWHRLREPTSALAYARSSVLNGCRSVHRQAGVRRRHLTRLASLDAACADTAVAADDRRLLAAALRGLPRRQREVLVLRYYCDLDVAEIAATLRIGPSAVRSTISRGLAALARVVSEE